MASQVRGTGSDEWQTPQELWNKLNQQYGFTLDCAASEANHKCERFCSMENSFFSYQGFQENDVLWCNPPFSNTYGFVFHLAVVSGAKNLPTVGIYRSDNMETKNWRLIWENADWIFVFDKRVHYVNPVGGDTCPFGSALFGFNCEPPKGLSGYLITTWGCCRP